ncbi:MAG: ABC transporter substrate-binding protein [Candidatus Latescibacterota bacterium]|nr:ABC transporter substrate-binding protein [Candidatus Latescibacterota bacterium]
MMMRFWFRWFLGISATVMMMAQVGVATTQTKLQTATEFLTAHDVRVQEIVRASDSLSAEQSATVKSMINEAFDFAELSHLALGDHWELRSEQERVEFTRVFQGIIEQRNFDSFVTYYREGEITYIGEELAKDGRATVRGEVPVKKERKEISYFLHRPDGAGWRIYDLSIDGTSTAAGYQKTYGRYISRHSFEKLLKRLTQQLEKLTGE